MTATVSSAGNGRSTRVPLHGGGWCLVTLVGFSDETVGCVAQLCGYGMVTDSTQYALYL